MIISKTLRKKILIRYIIQEKIKILAKILNLKKRKRHGRTRTTIQP